MSMERMVDRIIPADTAADLGAMAMMMYSLPRPVGATDGIAVYPGLSEDWRVTDAIEAWESSPNARHLLVAGTYEEEGAQPQPTLERLIEPPFNLQRVEGVKTQVAADNTPDQARWVADRTEELNISSLSLVVSPFHLLRAYCTTLKTFDKRDRRIPIIPVPARVSPSTIVPETGEDGLSMFYGEAERIRRYQPKGDVATLQELKDYISWLWEQPILTGR